MELFISIIATPHSTYFHLKPIPTPITTEKKMNHIFKVGDTGLTRDGSKYKILSIEKPGWQQPLEVELYPKWGGQTITHHNANGSYYFSQYLADWDLMPPDRSFDPDND